jgi:hypothetical protein
MLVQLSIRLSPEATLAALQETFRHQHNVDRVGQIVPRGSNMFVIYVVTKDAGPLKAFCRGLVDKGLAESVTAQRLDV